MFHAIRQWWTGGRARVSARLFLFELLVVILGVLIAQGVQQHQEGVALRERARTHIIDTKPDYAEIVGLLSYWRDHGQCVSERAMLVARVAADGGTIDFGKIGRPALPSRAPVAWDEDVRRAAAEAMGEQKMRDLTALESALMVNDEVAGQVSQDWAAFRLLDPAYGQPSSADRAAVRLVATRIADRIRLLRFKYEENKTALERLQIAPSPAVPEGTVDDCGMIWNWRPT